MRTSWMLAGVLAVSASAMASPNVPFSTVFDSTESFNGAQMLGAIQVVVGTGGDVFTNALLNDGNPIIVYSTPIANTQTFNSQGVAETDTPTVNLLANPQFTGFDNLALAQNSSAGARLFFAAQAAAAEGGAGGYGIIQLDITGGVPTLSNVAFDGTGSYSFSGTHSVINPDGTISLQVDAGGQALFPANTSSTPGVLVRGNAASTSQVFTPANPPTLANATFRVGLGNEVPSPTTPTAVAQLIAAGGQGVYKLSGASQTLISGSLARASSGASMVMGYTSTGSFSAALMLGQGTGGGFTQNVVLSKNGGAPQPILANSTTSITPGSGESALGELSPQGKIALFVPDGTSDANDTVQYADATAVSPIASVIAAVNTDVTAPSYTKVALSDGTPLPIIGLQFGGSVWVPEVNNAGTIIFNAEVYDASLSSDEQALLEWTPADVGSSPTVLLETGQPADLNGTPSSSVVDGFTLSDLAQESDFYKNSASDDNRIGVGVFYDDGSSAVLLTAQVPEPASMALITITGLGLLARRRRI
ncbi:MAG: PEP-CTERM sorting domain-containing protein [Tepidisphaeraceae bacterium]